MRQICNINNMYLIERLPASMKEAEAFMQSSCTHSSFITVPTGRHYQSDATKQPRRQIRVCYDYWSPLNHWSLAAARQIWRLELWYRQGCMPTAYHLCEFAKARIFILNIAPWLAIDVVTYFKVVRVVLGYLNLIVIYE
jgi:hypothetical protein